MSVTAYVMEYQGQGWLDPQSNSIYAKARTSTGQHPLCPVREMDVDKAASASVTYRKRTYYFCMEAHKRLFGAHPANFIC